MKTRELTSVEERSSGYTHCFQLKAVTDVNTAGLTQTVTLLSGLIAGDAVTAGAFYLPTAFTGGAGTNLSLEVGYDVAAGTDDPDGIFAGSEINSAATEVLAGLADGADMIGNFTGKAFVETASITALFTAVGANLSTLTAGEVWIFLRIVRLSQLGK
jgi:hypothetical protein